MGARLIGCRNYGVPETVTVHGIGIGKEMRGLRISFRFFERMVGRSIRR